jgi:hypothetical protein
LRHFLRQFARHFGPVSRQFGDPLLRQFAGLLEEYVAYLDRTLKVDLIVRHARLEPWG